MTLKVTRQGTPIRRLSAISSQPSTGSAISFSYQYNAANQRTQRTEADNSHWDYGYDSLGQVTNAVRRWADGTVVAGQEYGYAFDDIGNRQFSAVSGQQSAYTANSLNQYTSRTVPGYLWELGTAASNATVTVNNRATSRQGEYFTVGLSVTNAASAVYTQLTTVAVLRNAGSNQLDIVSQNTGHAFVPQSPESFTYDADGNLTGDGRWVYTWDAENRLIAMQTRPSVTNVAPNTKLEFAYDYQSRRASKVVSNWTGSAWTEASSLKFVYDGWNLLAEVGMTGSVVRSYVWGLDLSGTEQGAGGVGGLLAANLGTNGTHFVAFDGNGNVAALLNADTGSLSAQYEYSPFGETLRATGAVAAANPFRFSAKYTDGESGLLFYGFRYHQPATGRWLSRDPIEEEGGGNIYSAFFNCPTRFVDRNGKDNYDSGGENAPPVVVSPPVSSPTVPNFAGFYVVGSTMEVWGGRVWQILGFDHVDIAYNASVIYVGRGGGANRGGRTVRLRDDTYPLSIRTTGKMRYGQRAPCPCKGATDADVLDCLSKRRPIASRNCQGDVLDSIGDCCLSGWSSLVGKFFPNS
jgi:RHS repeat-associated protein